MAAIQLKSCRGRWTWRLLLGPCVVLAGIIGVMLGEFNFLELQRNIVQDVSDMMFIDDTTQTYHKGPLGKSTSELEQFQEWKKPMREALKECMQEHGDNQNECMDGFDFEVAVFNVTNTEDVVLQGSIPQVQELGPIFAKKYIDKFDIDTLHWDKTGVARFRQNASIELDRQRCGQACKKLLKQEIVIPNPAWAKIISEGLELPFGIVLAARHVIAEIAPTELRSQVMKMFGLANDMETTAVLATFFFPFSSSNSGFSSNSNNNSSSSGGGSGTNNNGNNTSSNFHQKSSSLESKLSNIGKFLQTTSSASVGGNCLLGALSLPRTTCLKVLTTFQSLIPKAWNKTLAKIRPSYGVGAAAPVFIRVRVEQALGFNDASFSDLLTEAADLTFGVLKHAVDAPGSYREVQMSSKFATRGTRYYISHGGAARGCLFDRDCKLDEEGSCTASGNCAPKELAGYEGQILPGQLWDYSLGYKGPMLTGSRLNLFNEGIVETMLATGEMTMHLPEYKDEGAQQLRIVDFRVSTFQRRIENCDGRDANSPGLDCDGPASTVNMAPVMEGMPFYISMPHFKSELEQEPMQVNASKPNGGAPYMPSSRVNITACDPSSSSNNNSSNIVTTSSSNIVTTSSSSSATHKMNERKAQSTAWCSDDQKFNSYLWVEPESGVTISRITAMQGNIRIASSNASNIFHPKLQDVLVPVYWKREGFTLPLAVQVNWAEIQKAPPHLETLGLIFLVPGMLCLFVGTCLIFAETRACLYKDRRTDAVREAVKALDARRKGEHGRNPDELGPLPTLHGQRLQIGTKKETKNQRKLRIMLPTPKKLPQPSARSHEEFTRRPEWNSAVQEDCPERFRVEL
eukprot:TRINITY_DN19036_c0_g1_i1.p1 TRINITY_DN19036_c0_g1~~TRINITY_DN19036_c0_g1_i1.p1  ORF type:complete len:881 (-),score=143.60 TRINITY_DN19036_c0_g1_i1:104-2671(-)